MWKAIVRAVASPTVAASVRIFFMRSSGAKGLPFSMPIAAKNPRVTSSSEPAGSFWTTSFSSSQNA